MMGRLAALILLGTVSLIQTAENSRQISLTVVEVGGTVTFQCSISDKEAKFFYWNKESLGYAAQTVAALIVGKVTFSEEFKDSRLTARQEEGWYFLTIRNVTKEDEATYFCHNAATYSQEFINGTFLSVNDINRQRSIYVEQSPKTESVQLGDSVTLQCSFHKENRVKCPDEHTVYWFRAGSEGFNPGLIYRHSNRSDEQAERSCVYSLSKTIQNSSDAGTYYCAVVTCGEILFGDGTKVETHSEPELGPVVLVFGALLACCVTVIAILMSQSNVCEHSKGTMTATNHQGPAKTIVDQSTAQVGKAKVTNSATLDFPTRRKRSEYIQECVYTVVRADCYNQHPSPQAE